MAPLDWTELKPETKDKLKTLFDGENPNMIDMISFEEQGMVIPRSYLKMKDEMKNFPVKEDDIWIVTFPKCGTTWMQETMTMLINDVDEEYGKLPHMLRSPFLEIDCLMDGQEHGELFSEVPEEMQEMFAALANGQIHYAKNMSGRRVLKSHMSFDFLPEEMLEKCKVVYVARTPKDCAVSMYYHMRDLPGHGFTASFNEFVSAFMEGVLMYGNYWDHLLSGWKLKDHPNVKFVWYEDMKKDTKRVVTELADFVNHPLSDTKIEELLHRISFDQMKKNPAANPASMLKLDEGKHFLRKGKIGDWKNHFSGEELKKIDDWVNKNIDRTKIQLPM